MNRQAIIPTVLLVLIAGFICACQVGRVSWRMVHDEFRLVPVQEWGFGVGYWDGVRTGGRIYGYGPVERMTNLYP